MGIWGMTHTAVQPMGQLQMGAIAGAFSAPIAVVVGSVAMVVIGLLFVLPNRRIRNLTLISDEAPSDSRPGEAPPAISAQNEPEPRQPDADEMPASRP